MSKLTTKVSSWWSRVRGRDNTIENPPARFTRTQRDETIRNLQHGFDEVLQLMISVRTHLDKQSDRSDRMLDIMEQLPDALKALPETNRNQARMLEVIEEHLEDQRNSEREIGRTLDGLADSSERQVQVMTAMHQQFDVRTETDKQMTETIGTLTGALGNLNQTSDASLRFLQDLANKNEQTQSELAEIVRRNRRHTNILAGTSCGIMVIALAAIVFALMAGGGDDTSTAQPALASNTAETPAPVTPDAATVTPAAITPVTVKDSTPAPKASDLLHGLSPAPVVDDEGHAEEELAAEPMETATTESTTDTIAEPDQASETVDEPLDMIDTEASGEPTTEPLTDSVIDDIPLPLTKPTDTDAAESTTFDPTGLADFDWLDTEPDASSTLFPTPEVTEDVSGGNATDRSEDMETETD